MQFEKYLEQVNSSEASIIIEPDWMQGRSAFGGLSAALVCRAMMKALTRTIPVRCLQVSFVGPVVSGPLDISATVLRQGSNVCQVMGRGEQNGDARIMILGGFGEARDSSIAVPAPQLNDMNSPERAQSMPYIEGVTPEFTKHFDFRYCTPIPFSGTKDTQLQGYVRFRDPVKNIDSAQLLGLVDAWPPTTLPMLKKPAPASSLNWTIEFVQPQPSLSGDEFCQYQAEIIESSKGYGHTYARIANSAGEMLAISHQTVTHFA